MVVGVVAWKDICGINQQTPLWTHTSLNKHSWSRSQSYTHIHTHTVSFVLIVEGNIYWLIHTCDTWNTFIYVCKHNLHTYWHSWQTQHIFTHACSWHTTLTHTHSSYTASTHSQSWHTTHIHWFTLITHHTNSFRLTICTACTPYTQHVLIHIDNTSIFILIKHGTYLLIQTHNIHKIFTLTHW